MADSQQTGVHRLAVHVNGSPSELSIDSDTLSWHKDSPESPSRVDKKLADQKRKQTILLSNVITIKRIEPKNNERKKNNKARGEVKAASEHDDQANDDVLDNNDGEQEDEDDDNDNKGASKDQPKLKIYYGRYKSTGHRLLKLKKLIIEAPTTTTTTTTTSNINRQPIEWIYRQIKQNLDKYESRRPKRLLVFVNPFGGKGKALHLYKSQVKRLLLLAGIETKLIVTRYANHARDTIEDPLFNVDYFDGIVCVGGDGMFSELMNGLLFRYNRDELLSMELSATLNRMRLTSNGQDNQQRTPAAEDQSADMSSSTSSSPVDQLRQQLGGIGRKFNSPNIPVGVIGAGSTDCNSFGLMGTNDVITATLNIILGNQIQVDVCSIHSIRDDKLLRFVSTFIAYGYFGDVIRESEKFRWLGPKRYDLTGLNTLIRNKSYKGLVRILTSDQDGSPHDLDSRCHLNCALCLGGPNALTGLRRASSTNKRPPSNRSLGPPARSKSYEISTRTMDEQPESEKLRMIEKRGSFVGVNAAIMACRCPQTRKGFSPGNHLANGCADLILVRPCSRLQYINYLLRTAGTKKSAFDLKFVEAHRCRQFEFIAQEDDVVVDQEGSNSLDEDNSYQRSSGRQSNKLRSSDSLSSSQQSSNSNSLDTKQSSSSISAKSEMVGSGGSSTPTTTATCIGGGDLDELRQGSSWNADGEILHEQSIRVKVNNRLLRVFGTGEPHHC